MVAEDHIHVKLILPGIVKRKDGPFLHDLDELLERIEIHMGALLMEKSDNINTTDKSKIVPGGRGATL